MSEGTEVVSYETLLKTVLEQNKRIEGLQKNIRTQLEINDRMMSLMQSHSAHLKTLSEALFKR
jgi:flagellar capping protein FliD